MLQMIGSLLVFIQPTKYAQDILQNRITGILKKHIEETLKGIY